MYITIVVQRISVITHNIGNGSMAAHRDTDYGGQYLIDILRIFLK